MAVRTPTMAGPALGAEAVRYFQTQAAPPSIIKAITKPITRPVLEGFLGFGRTISGLGACACCGTAGDGATLIRFLGFDYYYDAKVTSALKVGRQECLLHWDCHSGSHRFGEFCFVVADLFRDAGFVITLLAGQVDVDCGIRQNEPIQARMVRDLLHFMELEVVGGLPDAMGLAPFALGLQLAEQKSRERSSSMRAAVRPAWISDRPSRHNLP